LENNMNDSRAVRPAAFKDFQVKGVGNSSVVSVWVNTSLLPIMASAFASNQHPSLIDISAAYTDVFREGTGHHSNQHCSIRHDEDVGAILEFQYRILWTAGGALIKQPSETPNKAAAKIGYELRNTATAIRESLDDETPDITELYNESDIEIEFKDIVNLGVNTHLETACLLLKRSALIQIAKELGKGSSFHHLFAGLAEILDPDAEEVDVALDETAAASDERLIVLQGENPNAES
jgi:hypothetical protein